MLIPHNNSKAFELSSKRGEFAKKINSALLDTDGTTTEIKNVAASISATATTCLSARLRSTAAISISCLRSSWAAMCATCASTAT